MMILKGGIITLPFDVSLGTSTPLAYLNPWFFFLNAGWYASRPQGLVDESGLTAYERPTVFTTVTAPLHDRNLRRLSKTVESSLLFGHVRAAGPGASVHEYNCHPFQIGRCVV